MTLESAATLTVPFSASRATLENESTDTDPLRVVTLALLWATVTMSLLVVIMTLLLAYIDKTLLVVNDMLL